MDECELPYAARSEAPRRKLSGLEGVWLLRDPVADWNRKRSRGWRGRPRRGMFEAAPSMV
jgi:hypothetical protein